jgi:hypothetical protein
LRRGVSALAIVLLAAAAAAACSSGRPSTTRATDSPPRPAASATTSAAGGAQPSSQPSTQTSRLPRGSEVVHLDPAKFSARIDNPWWPMTPGSRWVFREVSGQGQTQIDEVTVTNRTKKIMGIDARVVHDVLTVNGQVAEDTLDWYAQDAQGNIWYLGEDTKEYQNGQVTSTAGSWQAGVDGAQPGILLPARPRPGLTYRQEYLKGEAEDFASVLSLDMRAKVPFGVFDHLLTTRDRTPLEPNVTEHKFYARGVGPVLAMTVSGGSTREELLSYKR